jgi:hypothetical protein
LFGNHDVSQSGPKISKVAKSDGYILLPEHNFNPNFLIQNVFFFFEHADLVETCSVQTAFF